MATTDLSGIGSAIACRLAGKGCSLVLNYTSDSSGPRTEELAAQLQEQYGIRAIVAQADMGSEKGPAYLVALAKNNFQHPKTQKFQIDIVINNAGVSRNQKIEDVDCDEFQRQYDVNVRGPLLLMQAVLPYLPHDRSGRIVNVSSVSSSLGYRGQSVYGGTKAALEAMTRTWAREVAERATVNAVNPGPVTTDMYKDTDADFQQHNTPFLQATPLATPRREIDPDEVYQPALTAGGRPAYEDEVAGIVSMLCSEEAGWTTGSVVCANGGMKFGF